MHPQSDNKYGDINVSNLAWGQIWPSATEFMDLAARSRFIPVVCKILGDGITACGVYQHLASGRPGTFLFESANPDGSWARWSFVGVHSEAFLYAFAGQGRWEGRVPVGIDKTGPIRQLIAQTLEVLKGTDIPGLPPLTGGLVGAIGWQALYNWEPKLKRAASDSENLPEVALALATDLIAFDHKDGSVFLIANAINYDGNPDGAELAYESATQRIAQMAQNLRSLLPLSPLVIKERAVAETSKTNNFFDINAADLHPSDLEKLPVSMVSGEFKDAIATAKKAIVDGEVFQVVLARRFELPEKFSPFATYRALRALNPSPYMYLLNFALADNLESDCVREFALVGSSPETLVKADQSAVYTFPIAGSRGRGKTVEEDQALGQEILQDPKELSEHTMLVDLARNDLSKVSDPGSVAVETLMELKRYSHVMHISSTVVGARREDVSALDILGATFPAGTLSGAPKPRAIELIAQIEPKSRYFYGGVIGYFDFLGNTDFAITIRTALLLPDKAWVQAGAGIVFDSVPDSEVKETENKAAAVVKALLLSKQLEAN